jgi:hypothetical protein
MNRFTCLTTALLCVGLVAVVPPSAAQAPTVDAVQETEMGNMRQKMMADMKAMDARLDALVSKMNAAKGDAKIEAMAEVLTTVVHQRQTMRDRMMDMQSRMMGHMMQHTAAGMSPEMKKMMMGECPMMKQMGAASEK